DVDVVVDLPEKVDAALRVILPGLLYRLIVDSLVQRPENLPHQQILVAYPSHQRGTADAQLLCQQRQIQSATFEPPTACHAKGGERSSALLGLAFGQGHGQGGLLSTHLIRPSILYSHGIVAKCYRGGKGPGHWRGRQRLYGHCGSVISESEL